MLCSLYDNLSKIAWVKMKRDMSIYKYCDIYMLLDNMWQKNIDDIFSRAKTLNLEKVCSYAIVQTASLLGKNNSYAYNYSLETLKNSQDFLHTVAFPRDKKTLVYKTKNIHDRFFLENREADLYEEVGDE